MIERSQSSAQPATSPGAASSPLWLVSTRQASSWRGFRVTAIGREEMSSDDATSVRKTHFGESAHGRLDERQHVRRVRFVLLGPEAVETHRRTLEQLGPTAGGHTQ